MTTQDQVEDTTTAASSRPQIHQPTGKWPMYSKIVLIRAQPAASLPSLQFYSLNKGFSSRGDYHGGGEHLRS